MAPSEPQRPAARSRLLLALTLLLGVLACTGDDDAGRRRSEDAATTQPATTTTVAPLTEALAQAVAEGGEDPTDAVAVALVESGLVADDVAAGCVADRTVGALGGDGLVAAARSLDTSFPLAEDGTPTDADVWTVVTATLVCSSDELALELQRLGVEATAAGCAAALVVEDDVVVAWALYGYGHGSGFAEEAAAVARGLLGEGHPDGTDPATTTAQLLAARLRPCLDEADRAAVEAEPPA